MSNENVRYENAKKYMCRWLPEEAMSGCKARQEGREPDDVECLVCVATTLEMSCEALWATVLCMGVKDMGLANRLRELKESCDSVRQVFFQVARKLKPEFHEKEREEYANIVEEMIEGYKHG